MDTDNCEDIALILKSMRAIDDKIIYQLNLATPTPSFRDKVDPTEKCKGFFNQLNEVYSSRDRYIKKCLSESTDRVRELKPKLEDNRDNIPLRKQLREEQSKIRDLQNELAIEEIIRGRSMKTFTERCREFYKPATKQ